ncbi:hypothetical protein V6x_56990 [Gimesia chilikensis]|uniref:Uncharacterized protein n=1 Tax=Gimesia chilikensis TaxID=2605989 RepID=A0A517WL25_9PLAN|nr:hypothetical protein [Gimesia chilikensis]QDU05955.1 hypothetical protein V6x_56990 [Gimesia chilikensis]
MYRILTITCFVMVLYIAANHANAEVVSIEATIKSVDSQNNKITIARKGKTTELDVSKNADISKLKIGQKVTLSYHLDLETVLKIETAQKDLSSSPEIVALHELNIASPNFAPWISKEGLSIYWTKDDAIWKAQRKNVDEPFQKQSRLFDGYMPSVSEDGLYMVLCRPLKIGNKNMGRKLFFSVRKNKQEDFPPPREIRELRDMGILMTPCISPDGLSLYMSCYGPDDNQKGHWVITRDNRSSKWDVDSKRRILPHPNPLPSTTPFVTDDGLSLLLTKRTNKTHGAFGEILVLTRDSNKDKIFSKFQKQIEVDGELIIGRFPRYCPATHELFFSAPDSTEKDSEGIWCIRNYDLSK